ncbi:MAG: AAA family ATPase [Bacteroidota bacterium]
MSEEPKLRIIIKDFRAIKFADIILNGITVVAGINGCGKSTISKLLYRTVKTSIDFDKRVRENLYLELRGVSHFLDELSRELDYFYRENIEFRKELKNEFDLRYRFNRLFNFNEDGLKEQENRILSAIDTFSKTFEELPKEYKKGDRFEKRFYRLERFFKEEFFEKEFDYENIDILVIFEKLKENIKKGFERAYLMIENRPIELLDNIIKDYFPEDIDERNYDIEELGALITNRIDGKLSNFLTINKVAYIDTPMIIGVDNIGDTNIQHWEELDILLKNKGDNINKKSKIGKILKDDIIDGEINYDNKNESFIYKRNDAFSIDLLSCATGLKSFSLLQILFNNGFFDDKTLLILDEPEAHLHPEWIVQYARLVVMLHKEFKVKFLIGSHNPDMVMAIKYIAKKELQDSSLVNFYVAKNFDKYRFSFENSQNDIEPIFSSFNASLDKINEFGASEE